MQTELNPTEARQASKPGVMRWVLMISLLAATVLLAVVYFYFVARHGA